MQSSERLTHRIEVRVRIDLEGDLHVGVPGDRLYHVGLRAPEVERTRGSGWWALSGCRAPTETRARSPARRPLGGPFLGLSLLMLQQRQPGPLRQRRHALRVLRLRVEQVERSRDTLHGLPHPERSSIEVDIRPTKQQRHLWQLRHYVLASRHSVSVMCR